MTLNGERKLSCKTEGGKIVCVAVERDSACSVIIDPATGRVVKEYRGKKGEALCKVVENEALKLFNLSEDILGKRKTLEQQQIVTS